MPEFIIRTFGCKTNQYESEGIRETLAASGWHESSHPEEAEAAIINTCTVTSRAGASARNTIRNLRRKNPYLRIILTGCAVDVEESWLQELQIEKTFKNTEKHLIAPYLNQDENSALRTGNGFDFSINHFEGHTRAFLKIHDGCDNFCSYCIIPYARGLPRSRSLQQILIEATELANNGYHEQVLTGINIGAYNYEGSALPDLLQKLCEIPALQRIRLGSIEPIYLSTGLLQTIRDNPKICPHLHLPLQSGSNTVLQSMNRKYSREFFLDCIYQTREMLIKPAITTDIIVGFPTEDDQAFSETVETITQVGFARSHIFLFSPRSGTPAAKLKRPPQREADQRRLILEELTTKQAQAYSKTLIGFNAEAVMLERINKNTATGYLQRYIRAEIAFESCSAGLLKGETYPVTITGCKEQNPNKIQESENVLECRVTNK